MVGYGEQINKNYYYTVLMILHYSYTVALFNGIYRHEDDLVFRCSIISSRNKMKHTKGR